MSPKFLSVALAVLVAAAGCQKKPEAPPPPPAPKPVTVELVKETERSRHFLAVNQHLELGGTLYGYVDVDGDVLKLASSLQKLATEIAKAQPGAAVVAKQDYAAILTTLGLTDVKAFGISSVPDGTGFFRNRAFFYTPGDRHGLLLGLGGKPGPFTHLNLAPADTAFFSEADLDLPVMYRTIKDVVTRVAGEPAGNQMEAALKSAGEKVSLSVLDLIYGLKGHSATVLRVDPEKTIQLPGKNGLVVPAFSLLVCVDNIAPAVEPALTKSPLFKRSEVGTTHVYEFAQPLPVKEIQPVIVADGGTLYFATSRAFLEECRNLKTGLAQTPEFQQSVARVGAEGNGISYVHPRLFDQLRRIETLNPELSAQVKPFMTLLLANVPKTDRPMIAIRTNLPDGILVRSYWDRSFKQEIAVFAMYNPMSLGLAASMAIPAFQKVRMASQDKAVLNNLRMLSAAADQYYLEHGVTRATYDDIVGPGKYVTHLQSVAGESYRGIRFVQGQPLTVRMPDGRMIRYPMSAMPPQPRRAPAPRPPQKHPQPAPQPPPPPSPEAQPAPQPQPVPQPPQAPQPAPENP